MTKPFEKGDRVRRIETGETGTVRRQFIDGYVSLNFDDGRPAQLAASGLEELTTSPEHIDSEGSHGLFCSHCESYLGPDFSHLPEKCSNCGLRVVRTQAV